MDRRLITLSPAGEYQGAWHFFTVTGGEFLDESFRRIAPYVVDQDTTAYFRYRDAGQESVPSVVTIRSESLGQPPETASITIPLNRLAQTSTYMAGPFTLRPPAVEPPASSISRNSVQQASSLLTVFAPTFQVKAFFLPKQVAQAAGLVNGLPIKVELFYRGEGPPPEQQWFVLRANERTYLGDGLRLTAELPPGWGTPTSYGWSFEVDGLPYMPAGIDPNAQSVLIDPTRKAGPWKIKLRVFWGAIERRYERPLDIWFESEPTAAIAWVDPDLINTTTYVGTTGSTLGDCTKVVSLMIRVLTNLARGQFPDPPPAAERAFYNAATLKCVGPSPSDAIDRPRFATLADLLTYMNHQGGINFKAASAVYFRAPVRSGEVKPDRAWRRIPEARAGRTEFILPETLHSLPTGTVFTLPGQTASDNGTFRNRPVGVDNTTYWLNKARIGLPGQAFACFINTGLPVCDLTNVVPYIWSKLIYTPESPVLRRNLQRTNTSFSTFRFYSPEGRVTGLRQFPLVRDGDLMRQSEPNAFLQNPEDSNAD